MTVLVPDLKSPSSIREQVVTFLVEHPKAGLLLEDLDRLLEHHHREDILAFLDDLRGRMEGRGPFVVTFDPKRTSGASARDVRAAVSGRRRASRSRRSRTRSGDRSCAGPPTVRARSPRR